MLPVVLASRVPRQNTTDQVASAAEMYLFTSLEAGSPRSRCWQGWFLLRSLSWAFRGLPFFPLCGLPYVYVSEPHLLIRTPVMLEQGLT